MRTLLRSIGLKKRPNCKIYRRNTYFFICYNIVHLQCISLLLRGNPKIRLAFGGVFLFIKYYLTLHHGSSKL